MSSSKLLQARVPAETSRQLLEDIDTLGLAGPSEAIREALAMLHRKAQLVAMGREYDDVYQGEMVPVSDVTAALYPDND